MKRFYEKSLLDSFKSIVTKKSFRYLFVVLGVLIFIFSFGGKVLKEIDKSSPYKEVKIIEALTSSKSEEIYHINFVQLKSIQKNKPEKINNSTFLTIQEERNILIFSHLASKTDCDDFLDNYYRDSKRPHYELRAKSIKINQSVVTEKTNLNKTIIDELCRPDYLGKSINSIHIEFKLKDFKGKT